MQEHSCMLDLIEKLYDKLDVNVLKNEFHKQLKG